MNLKYAYSDIEETNTLFSNIKLQVAEILLLKTVKTDKVDMFPRFTVFSITISAIGILI